VVLLVVVVSQCCHAALYEGQVSSSGGIAYLGKFCFRTAPSNTTTAGYINWEFWNGPSTSEGFWVALFDDQDGSWNAVYGSHGFTLSCSDAIQHAANYHAMGGSTVFFDPVLMSPSRIEETVRPRFWWAALVTCYGTDAASFTDIGFRAHFTQWDESVWSLEFGVNEEGLNTFYIIMFAYFSAVGIVHCCGLFMLKREVGAIHPLVKLYSGSLMAQWWSAMFFMIHFVSYAKYGYGPKGTEALGAVLDVFARVALIVMLFLVAQGWTISRETVRYRWAMALLAVTVFAFYIALIIWDAVGRDPASTLYTYDSVAGYLICALMAILFVAFIVTVAMSYRNEDDVAKKSLYAWIGVWYGLWLISLPLLVAIGTAVAPWVREKVVRGISGAIAMLAYAILTWTLWPSRADKYFKIKTPDVLRGSAQYNEL